MNPDTNFNDVIFNFCTKILPEFHKIMTNLEELDEDLSSREFAMNLMDLGRMQMSEVEEPTEQDVDFISGYIKSLNLDNTREAFYTAYAGGCVMGLVTINEVPREDFGKALHLIEDFAQNEFSNK